MRKVYLLPNFVTTANLFCGFYSIISSIKGDFVTASWAILAASVFDLLDGRVARLAKATSDFGVEYDSLCDLVSFGLAPAILMYLWALQPFGELGWIAAFLYMTCGALRLARFNVTTSSFPKGYFQGLAIPVAAGMLVATVLFQHKTGFPEPDFQKWVSLVLSIGLGGLMISSVPFPSFKEFNWRSKASFGYMLIGILVMIAVFIQPELTLFAVGITYISASLIWAIVLMTKGSLPKPSKNPSEAHS